MTTLSPQAELRAYYARALAADNKRDAAIDQLASAAASAQSGDPVPLGQARRAIRDVANSLSTDDSRLPQWATSPIPDEHVGLINRWAAQRGWPAIDTFLGEHAGALQHDDFRASLTLIADLFPDDPSLATLTALLAGIDRDGLDAVLASGRAANHDAELVEAWIATQWEESAYFLQEHNAELTTPRIRNLLAENSDNDACRQHLAILYLADTLPADKVYQIINDATVAAERALDLVESGDLSQLPLILAAAPNTATDGITGAFIRTVSALAAGDYGAAHQLAELIAEHGNPSQREALAIRLRAFASHQPNQSPALDVAGIIAPETGQT